MKRCTKCRKNSPIANFYKDKNRKDGLRVICKDCDKTHYNTIRIKKTRNDRKKAQVRKQELVDYKGGKCSICGYNKCIAALDFHHVIGEKEFGIGTKHGLSMKEMKVEADKCILVCSNCHRELHYNIIRRKE